MNRVHMFLRFSPLALRITVSFVLIPFLLWPIVSVALPEILRPDILEAKRSEAPFLTYDSNITLAQTVSVTAGDWPMAGANPQRTSWTSEEVRGRLNPIWYRVIEPYIFPGTQIIAANGLLYISTARGLYALDAVTGDTIWVYPTDLPLGNAPTVFNDVVYVGGYDHKLYALDANTGGFRWTFEVESGFATNPLVLDIDSRTLVYAGNRDGNLYAIEDLGNTPTLAWQYETGGPILFSAAYAEGTVYIASNDSHAYALDARSGALVWQSPKLPGAGFHVWWPVVYQNVSTGADILLLAGSNNYRMTLAPGFGFDLQGREQQDIFSDGQGPFGPRMSDGRLDAASTFEYFETKPWRRTSILLDLNTGEELTFDLDSDGKPEYAPILWHGTHSGNRYPPVVGRDGIIYQSNAYIPGEWISGGHITGWMPGSSSISTPSALRIAMDEPLAYAMGGNVIYWSHCNDRSAGAVDLSIPITDFYPAPADQNREWLYFNYGLVSQIPGYNILYQGVDSMDYTLNNLFQGPDASPNGVYGQHGYQNPPIPYAGRVYIHRSNAVISFGDYEGVPTQLPMARTVAGAVIAPSVTGDELRHRLIDEVRKILAAGHLRPGYRSTGLFDGHSRGELGDHLIDYFHDPSDTLYTLILALRYLPTDLQQSVRLYLQSEYNNYPPYLYTHVGWRDGAPREPFYLPQEVELDLVNNPPWASGAYYFGGWDWPPQMFYALWKYADEFGTASTVFEFSRSKLTSPPSDAYLIEYPYVHNAYIAGYLGYLQLEALAGYAESINVSAELNRLLALRASTFDKDTPYTGGDTARALSVARNFMFLVPELGQYLHDTIYGEVQEAVDEYEVIAPYWFVSDYDVTLGEGANQHFFDYWALFQAKALILQEPGIDLVKYLDVPAVQVGDLFYIQNLVAVLDKDLKSGLSKVGSSLTTNVSDAVTYTLSFSGYTGTLKITDTLPIGVSSPTFLASEGTNATPIYNADAHEITWTVTDSLEKAVALRYRVTVMIGQPAVLKNTAELDEMNGIISAATFTVIANPHRCFLPVVVRRH